MEEHGPSMEPMQLESQAQQSDLESTIRTDHEQLDTGKMIIRVLVNNKQTLIIGISILVYFAAAVVVYSSAEGWDFVTCIYFAVVVVTTVGYGDYLPSTDSSKIGFIFLSHFGLAIVAFAIGHVIDVVRSVFLAVVKADDDALGIFQQEARRRRRRMRSLLALIIYLVILLTGTVVFATCLEWGDKRNSWINGLYLTVVTVTTVGFGDFSPAGSTSLKVFGTFLMIVGIPSTVTALALATELVFGDNRDEVKLHVIKDHMTSDKFKGMTQFVEKMRKDGIGNYRNQGSEKISRFEFLCFVLVQNQIVEMTNIKNVMKNFDSLDTKGTSFISEEDIWRSGLTERSEKAVV
jgi:voltage-gated potassium channel Kch